MRRQACAWCLIASFLAMGRAPLAADDASLDTLANDVRELQVAYDHQPEASFKEHLAAAYNSYAIALAQAGQIESGVTQLRRAIELVPQQPQLRQNLASLLTERARALVEARRHREAQALLQEALTYHEQSAPAWAMLGLIHYEAQRVADAERAWKRALALDPQLPGVQERLHLLQRERTVEQPFNKLSQVSFDIRYAEGLPRDAEYELREVLEEARQGVGQDFGHYPSQQITVLLYTPEQFRRLRDETPEWVGGQYDGKVRLPLMTDPRGAQFRQVVWHEYTHVIVQELAHGRCPTWLNEGLAEYEGARQQPKPFPRLRQALTAGQSLPLARLQEHFSEIRSAAEAALAYEQSRSIVVYLVDRYGLWRLKRLLKQLGEGAPFEDALFQEFRLRLPDVERRWQEWARAAR